jgi:hypothetical protein
MGTFLAIIECAPDRNIVNVRVSDSSHLGFLDGRNASLWVKDENRHVGFASQTINGSAKRSLRFLQRDCF